MPFQPGSDHRQRRLILVLLLLGACSVSSVCFPGDVQMQQVKAAVLPVPATPLFPAANTSPDESQTPVREQNGVLSLIIVAMTTAIGMSIIFRLRQKWAERLLKKPETKLERSAVSHAQQYGQLSKYANDVIVLVDHDDNAKIVEINDRATAVYGYSREELLRMTVRDLRAPDALDSVEDELKHVRERDGFIFETVQRRKDGTTFPVEISSRALEAGGKRLYLGIIRDISERRQAERALIQEKNKFEAIIAAIGDGISIQDRNFKILYQNQVHKNLIGDHVGEFCYQAYEHSDAVCQNCPVAQSFQDGMIHTMERSTATGRGTRYVEITTSPLRDEAGGIIAGIEAVRDITGRKQVGQALIESENRYKKLIESVTDYMYTVEVSNGRAVSTRHGPGCVTVTGYTSADYQKDPNLWSRMIFEEDRKFVIEKAEAILAGVAVAPFEHRIIHKHGSLRWVRNTPVPRYSFDGILLAYDGLVTDITPVKLLENQLRQAQKMEAVGQLAGGVAHDFNNILTAIIGYANLLLMKMPQTDICRTYVDNILSSAERAAHLTHSLLAFSRKQIIDLKPVNVNEIITRVEKLLCRVIGEDIEFKTRLGDANLIVLADSIQIEQILMNLATNARDAMPDGGTLLLETDSLELGEEFVRAHSYGKPGRYALIAVSDTGIGMDTSVKSRIFEPFFTTKEVGKGTGLGLAMVYGIVKQHNGYIHVYSEPGQGTTFKVYLPLIASTAGDEEQQGGDAVEGGSETVLLAEDDSSVRKLTKSVLEDFGYTVIEAVDGEDAVRKFNENRDTASLLVLDIIMPKKNGKETYEEIRKIRPGIKTLFTSGYTADVVHQKRIMETGLDFIVKPTSPSAFLKKVREVLDKSNAE
jgi:two-component system cell cycle sensor histidine kinase/response regulator CckA